jgi:hypothetical protein
MVQVFQTDTMACQQPATQTSVNRSRSELLLILGGRRSKISKQPAHWTRNADRFLYNDLQITETDEAVIIHHTTADMDLNILMFLHFIALWPYLQAR